ncbi:MAG: hypothetical protein IPK76_22360 [Lewinellaceae bacterium]|nr:hypothetical protein [Lewinellaceae bacterium]
MNKLSAILLLFACSLAQAQTPVFRLREAKGIWNVQMTVAFQDSNGWMWFGSRDGLYRYDGLTYQAIGLPDSFPAGPVSAMYEWGGRIWVGFEQGSIGFIPLNSVFRRRQAARARNTSQPFRHGNPKRVHRINRSRLFSRQRGRPLDRDPRRGGVYCLKNERLYQFSASDDGLSGDDIYALACDAAGNIWAGTDAGASICSLSGQGKKQVRNLTTSDGLPDEIITALLADHHGNIWLGTHEKGASRYNVSKQAIDLRTAGWMQGPVVSMAAFGSNELWIGTSANGLFRLNLVSGETLPMPDASPLGHENPLAVQRP